MSYDHHMATGRRKRRPFDRLEESCAYYIRDKETKEIIMGEPFDTMAAAIAAGRDLPPFPTGDPTLEIVKVGTATISVDVVATIEKEESRPTA